MDARRLYLEHACSSMYTYAREILGMEEGAAYKRIRAARAGKKYPCIFEMLACGKLHLSGVTILASVLTQENHQELLSVAAHKSKREIEELVAERFPSPDVPVVVRKLPGPRVPREPQPRAVGPAPRGDIGGRGGLQGETPPAGSALSQPSASPLARPALVRPLSAERYKVQFTANCELHDKLREAQDLLRHQIPSGDIAAVIEKALTVLVEDVKRRRFGIGRRRRRTRTGSKKEAVPGRAAASRGRVEGGVPSPQASPGTAAEEVASASLEPSSSRFGVSRPVPAAATSSASLQKRPSSISVGCKRNGPSQTTWKVRICSVSIGERQT